MPDIAIYIEALEKVIGQKSIQGIDLRSPFLLRSVDPGIYETKRNRFPSNWEASSMGVGGRNLHGLPSHGSWKIPLEASGHKGWWQESPGEFPLSRWHRDAYGSQYQEAGLFVRGEDQLNAHAPNELEVLECDLQTFKERLLSENHTLKRALTDPTLFI